MKAYKNFQTRLLIACIVILTTIIYFRATTAEVARSVEYEFIEEAVANNDCEKYDIAAEEIAIYDDPESIKWEAKNFKTTSTPTTNCNQEKPVKPVELDLRPENDFIPVPVLEEETVISEKPLAEAMALIEIYEEAVDVSKMTYIGRHWLTGYDQCVKCCGKAPTDEKFGLTASGTYAEVGRTCAFNDYPFGTILYIDGIGYRTIEDRGGMASGVIDVFCEDHSQCYSITGTYDVYIVPEA